MLSKKIYLLILLILIGFGLFFYNKQSSIKEEALAFYCDLSNKDCEFLLNGKKIFIKSSEKPIIPMDEFELFIENLGEYKNLRAKIFGLNMYMGDIFVDFDKIDKNSYKANILLSSCPLDVMIYRILLFNGDKKLDIAFDFEVKK